VVAVGAHHRAVLNVDLRAQTSRRRVNGRVYALLLTRRDVEPLKTRLSHPVVPGHNWAMIRRQASGTDHQLFAMWPSKG